MENRIEECQADLFADRTSTATMRANQLRLWFASMAYVLVCALRRIGLCHTDFAEATCGTIRLKFLKVGALVRVSVRRIKVAMGGVAATRQSSKRDRDPQRQASLLAPQGSSNKLEPIRRRAIRVIAIQQLLILVQLHQLLR
jgi:hypothetical protein